MVFISIGHHPNQSHHHTGHFEGTITMLKRFVQDIHNYFTHQKRLGRFTDGVVRLVEGTGDLHSVDIRHPEEIIGNLRNLGSEVRVVHENRNPQYSIFGRSINLDKARQFYEGI
jgi:hypothetical protein